LLTTPTIILFVMLISVCFFTGNISLLNAQTDSTEEESKNTYVMSKSPRTALWRSLALPGLGQLYVESYWKAPIFFGATVTLVYFIIDNHNNFVLYDNQLEVMSKTDVDYNITKIYREYYRDNRDMSGFYLLGVYILSAVDAYVGAHLYDFQVDDNLAMGFGFSSSPIPSINLLIKF
jgi:hypothetical protein